jgi:hypothetical protein
LFCLNIISRALLLLFLLIAPAMAQQPVFVVGTAPVPGNCALFFSTTQIKDGGFPCSGSTPGALTGTLNAQLIGTGTFGFASVCTPTTAGQLCYWNGSTWTLSSAPVRAGDIFYWNGSAVTTLPGNNSGTQFLQENLSGVPSWATVAGGGSVISVSCGGVTISTSGTCPPAYGFTNCALAASVSGGNLTVNLTDNGGATPSINSPCTINYRNVSLSTGSFTQVITTGAVSFTANAGSTFGNTNTAATCVAASSCPFRLWVIAINSGSGTVLGLVDLTNATGVRPLNEATMMTTLACNACATATTIGQEYSTAVQTNKSFIILGYLEWSNGLATAGTWASGPTVIQTIGPGVHKPGDYVQTLQATTSTVNANTTASFTTALSLVIDPTSSANPIQALATFAYNTGAGLVNGVVAIFGGPAGTTELYSSNINNGSGGTIGGPGSVQIVDIPGTNANVTYSIQNKGDGTHGLNVCSGTDPGARCALVLVEIMG